VKPYVKHFEIMKLCDSLQMARNILLELDESEDAATLELLYQKYNALYHEHLRNLYESTPIRKSST
jgi:hypothetical protein